MATWIANSFLFLFVCLFVLVKYKITKDENKVRS